jgi:hypothetical protein
MLQIKRIFSISSFWNEQLACFCIEETGCLWEQNELPDGRLDEATSAQLRDINDPKFAKAGRLSYL